MIVVWGVSGCGKSTVGQLLAQRLNWSFYDADDFHPQANIDKMRRGIALDDEDRYPWLDVLAALIEQMNKGGKNGVLACSALKASYRTLLGFDHKDVYGVHLSGAESLIEARLASRQHEFMNRKLLASQIATLETDTDSLTLDIASSPSRLCEQIIDSLGIQP
jgi:gluconokinase